MPKIIQSQKNDVKKSTMVEVSLPSRIRIELVQGNELRHYEIFSLATSLLLSTAVGFWTAYLTTETNSKVLLASASAFTLFTLASSFAVYYYRSKVYNGHATKFSTLDEFKDEGN